MNASDSIKKINTLSTVEEVREFVKDETRKNVLDAASLRIKALQNEGGHAPASDTDPSANDTQAAASEEGAADDEGDDDEDLDDEKDADTEAPAPTPPAAPEPPATTEPLPPARERNAPPASQVERRKGHMEQQLAGKPAPPVTRGKGDQPKATGGVYVLQGADGQGRGKIITAEGSFSRQELANDQAMLEKLYNRGFRGVKKVK